MDQDATLLLPADLPEPMGGLLRDLLPRLAATGGVVAVALGGSWARGAARPESDVDLALYYDEDAPFSIPAIRALVGAVGGRPDDVVTGFYEWGPWVNGGAWVHSPAGKVDLLYRNVDQVLRVIADAREGVAQLDYLQQPPYGFPSVVYLGETATAIPLVDPGGVLADLKAQVRTYPEPLRQAIVQDSLWSAEFALYVGRQYAARGEPYGAVGCLTRALAFLTQALFALNEAYFVTDKGALETIAAFSRRPDGYAEAAADILAHPGGTQAALEATAARVTDLWRQVVALADGRYRPRYAL